MEQPPTEPLYDGNDDGHDDEDDDGDGDDELAVNIIGMELRSGPPVFLWHLSWMSDEG